MRVGFYQFRPLFGKVDRNLRRVVNTLRKVEADLIVLPELAFTGYYFKGREELEKLSEDPRHSTTIETLTSLCRDRDFHIVTGFAERQADKCFNSAILMGPDGIEHVYRKLHLFNEEKLHFDEGDIPLRVNTVRDARIGMMVCFDWAFPEVARVLALQGAEIVCHPSNLVLSYCQQTMLSRCLENRIFAITANRFGADTRPQGKLRFTGKSQIVAPGGDIIHRAASQRETLFIADIDPVKAREKHITNLNDLFNDRKPEFYGPLVG